MTITERTNGGVCILDIDGPITIGPGGSDMLADKVRSLLQQGHRQLLINLAAVPYMDSTGLGAMVHAYATATRQGGSVKLLNSTKQLHDLLVITKLSTVFESFDSESAAVASFAHGLRHSMATATLHLTVSDTAGRRSVTVSASPFSIGRSSENELQLTDAQVSRRHAELVESADGWRIRDCGSRFGTFVNDARVEETAVTSAIGFASARPNCGWKRPTRRRPDRRASISVRSMRCSRGSAPWAQGKCSTRCSRSCSTALSRSRAPSAASSSSLTLASWSSGWLARGAASRS